MLSAKLTSKIIGLPWFRAASGQNGVPGAYGRGQHDGDAVVDQQHTNKNRHDSEGARNDQRD